VQAGDTDIEDPIDLVAHHLRRDRSFLSNRYVGRARREHADAGQPGPVRVAVDGEHPRGGVVCGIGQPIADLRVHLGADPRGKHLPAALTQARDNRNDLIGRLALGKDHLGEARAQ